MPHFRGARYVLMSDDATPGATDFTTDPNMQGYWYFENGWTDGSGKGNTLTPSGTPTFDNTAGEFKQGSYAAKFVSASSQKAQRTDANMSAAFPGKDGVSYTAMTVGAWIRPVSIPGSGQETYLHKGFNAWTIYYDANWGTFSVDWANAVTCRSNTVTPTAGTWYHIVAVWTGTHVNMYIDGTIQTSQPANSTAANDNAEFVVGSAGNLNYSNSIIDEVFVLDRALNSTEINSIKNNKLDGSGFGVD